MTDRPVIDLTCERRRKGWAVRIEHANDTWGGMSTFEEDPTGAWAVRAALEFVIETLEGEPNVVGWDVPDGYSLDAEIASVRAFVSRGQRRSA